MPRQHEITPRHYIKLANSSLSTDRMEQYTTIPGDILQNVIAPSGLPSSSNGLQSEDGVMYHVPDLTNPQQRYHERLRSDVIG